MKKKPLLTIAFTSVLLLSAVAGTQFANLGRANPYHHIWIYEGDVSPDRSTAPPIILLLFPEDHTVHAVDTISLSLNVSIGNSSTASSRVLDEIYYETDWQPTGVSETIHFTIKSFPTALVVASVASVAVVSVGLLVYFKKRKR